MQISTVVFTEKELQEQKLIYDGIRTLLAPKLNLSKKSTFYFTCYNKKIDSLSFLKKIELFKTMFLKKQPNIEGEMRKIELVSK